MAFSTVSICQIAVPASNASTSISGDPHSAAREDSTDNGNPIVRPPKHIIIEQGGNERPPHHGTKTDYGLRGYTPTQIKKAYGFDDSVGDGAGQTIAVIVVYTAAQRQIQHDFDHYSREFNLPPAILEFYELTPSRSSTTADTGWAFETAMDVELAHAIAPAARILVIVAGTNEVSGLMRAVDYAVNLGADEVSMSWGINEWPSVLNFDSHFTGKPYVSFFAASGDDGPGVQFPAASPAVTGVGGTTLKLDHSGNLTTQEIGWTGSGGGVSKYIPKPSFQGQAQVPSSVFRSVPDVSLNADFFLGFAVFSTVGYKNLYGWFSAGGTSAGSPSWAAFAALVNARRKQNGKLPLKSFNEALYAVYAAAPTTGPNALFRDITSGCNAKSSCAHEGYDTVTGLGSPNALNLFNALVNY